ncbi:hypothetical protein C8R44DRAFT_974855 [Mycena epipterygia]|nr:hypothetical protein C8R44DRAFT_974855 [Mycena epipterygia]
MIRQESHCGNSLLDARRRVTAEWKLLKSFPASFLSGLLIPVVKRFPGIEKEIVDAEFPRSDIDTGGEDKSGGLLNMTLTASLFPDRRTPLSELHHPNPLERESARVLRARAPSAVLDKNVDIARRLVYGMVLPFNSPGCRSLAAELLERRYLEFKAEVPKNTPGSLRWVGAGLFARCLFLGGWMGKRCNAGRTAQANGAYSSSLARLQIGKAPLVETHITISVFIFANLSSLSYLEGLCYPADYSSMFPSLYVDKPNMRYKSRSGVSDRQLARIFWDRSNIYLSPPSTRQ